MELALSWILGTAGFVQCHITALPQDHRLLPVPSASAGAGRRQSLSLTMWFVHVLYAYGLVPLASVPLVCYFSLEVLEGPIWSFLCTDAFPLYSISYLFSPVTCRVAHKFTSWTEEEWRSSAFPRTLVQINEVSMWAAYSDHRRQCWDLLISAEHLLLQARFNYSCFSNLASRSFIKSP